MKFLFVCISFFFKCMDEESFLVNKLGDDFFCLVLFGGCVFLNLGLFDLNGMEL